MHIVLVALLSLAVALSGCRRGGDGDGEGGMGGAAGAAGSAGGVSGAGGANGAGGEAGSGGDAGAGGMSGAGGSAGAGGEGGAAGGGGHGGAAGGGGFGGAAGSGGMPENRCPFYTDITVSPTLQSLGNLFDIDTEVLDPDGDPVEVRVTSSCGEVADPLQAADPVTGESSTTVRCDQVGACSVTISVSDDGFDPEGCDGTNIEATSTVELDCQPPLGN